MLLPRRCDLLDADAGVADGASIGLVSRPRWVRATGILDPGVDLGVPVASPRRGADAPPRFPLRFVADAAAAARTLGDSGVATAVAAARDRGGVDGSEAAASGNDGAATWGVG